MSTPFRGRARSLLTLINDILDYSKIEAGKMDLYLESVAIRPLVDQQIQLFRAQAEQKGLRLECQVDSKLPPPSEDRRSASAPGAVQSDQQCDQVH